jgi:hypothetical protein
MFRRHPAPSPQIGLSVLICPKPRFQLSVTLSTGLSRLFHASAVPCAVYCRTECGRWCKKNALFLQDNPKMRGIRTSGAFSRARSPSLKLDVPFCLVWCAGWELVNQPRRCARGNAVASYVTQRDITWWTGRVDHGEFHDLPDVWSLDGWNRRRRKHPQSIGICVLLERCGCAVGALVRRQGKPRANPSPTTESPSSSAFRFSTTRQVPAAHLPRFVPFPIFVRFPSGG